jgi:hypothetical protein
MLERVEVEEEREREREREREYLSCGRGSKLTITTNDAEAAQGDFHGGKLDLHLPKVDVEEVEEHPRTSHSSKSAREVVGAKHNFKAKTLDPLQDQIEPLRTKSRKILGSYSRAE